MKYAIGKQQVLGKSCSTYWDVCMCMYIYIYGTAKKMIKLKINYTINLPLRLYHLQTLYYFHSNRAEHNSIIILSSEIMHLYTITLVIFFHIIYKLINIKDTKQYNNVVRLHSRYCAF